MENGNIVAICPCHKLHGEDPFFSSVQEDIGGKSTSSSEATAGTSILCPICVDEVLSSRRRARIEARRRRDASRASCAASPSILQDGSSSNSKQAQSLPHLAQRVEELRLRLARLSRIRDDASVRLASASVTNDAREGDVMRTRHDIDAARDALSRLRNSTQLSTEEASENGGFGLHEMAVTARKDITRVRAAMALSAFDMHRVDSGIAQPKDKRNQKNQTTSSKSQQPTPSGIGKIGGLPLPNAGPSLYGVLPPRVLLSSLRLVASLTSILAVCLGVELPHPIAMGRRSIDDVSDVVRAKSHHSAARNLLSPWWWDESGKGGVYHETKTADSSGHTNEGPSEPTASNATKPTTTTKAEGSDDKTPASSKSLETNALITTTTDKLQSGLSGSMASINSTKALVSSFVDTYSGSALGRAFSRVVINSNNKPIDPSTGRDETSHDRPPSVVVMGPRGIRGRNRSKKSLPLRQMDAGGIAKRVRMATCALLWESHQDSAKGGTQYALLPPRCHLHQKSGQAWSDADTVISMDDMTLISAPSTIVDGVAKPKQGEADEEEFAVALQLLQNDVAALCIRAGVPLSTLHPAEALILNLESLRLHLLSLLSSLD